MEKVSPSKQEITAGKNVVNSDPPDGISGETECELSDKEKILDRLRISEEKYRVLVENAREAIFVAQDGMVRFTNFRLQEITGYLVEELTSRPFTDFIHPEYRSLVKKRHIQRLKGEEVPSTYDFRIVKKQGDAVWVELKVVTIDWEGKPASLNFLSDISERRKAESELKARQAFLDRVIDQSPFATWISDANGVLLRANPALKKFLNLTDEQLVGKYNVLEDPLVLRQGLMPLVHTVFEEGKTINFTCDWDGKDIPNLDLKGSNSVSIEATMFPIFNTEGELTNAVLNWIDVTDRKRVEEEKQKLEKQLHHVQKMEAVGTLAGGVAHDFNNLLQAINGYTQLLLLDKKDNEDDHQILQAIQDAGMRAGGLVKQLLLFSRKAESERKSLQLNNEVEQAQQMLERTIPKMIDIELHLESRLWTISADPVQMQQIILNLGTNAADAMPNGGKIVIETQNLQLGADYARIHLGVKPGRYVLLMISDTGHGMGKDTIDKIFEPFFTTKEIGKGTGLGLASVYGIVKSHSGFINCYSEIGHGTNFKIYLPAGEREMIAKAKNQLGKHLKNGKETILIVDDEEHIRGFATRALKKFGYTTLCASSGEEALQTYRERSPEIDMVMMDIGMPGMGGHQCLQELININPAVKVLITSGYSINAKIKETIEAGAAGYVAKPYRLKDLLQGIRDILDGRRLK